MANPFYTYSGSIIPGTLGRAEAVAAEFTSVQAGFADLAITGTDSGSASAYVVATLAGQPSALADGAMVSFKAANSNTGAATIAVNGLAATQILRSTGAGLQSGDINGGVWITLTYNSSFSAWCLPSSAPTTTYSGTISNAAPAKQVTLVAAAGSSTSAMPIDATLAISTAISPTWIGNHSFTGTSSFSGPLTISGTSTISGPLSVTGVTTFSNVLAVPATLAVGGTASFYGPLTVSGTSTFSGSLTVNGTTSITGPFTIAGTATISGPLAVTGALTVSGTGSASGPWTFSNNLTVTGTGSFSGPLTVTGAMSVASLTVSGTASVAGPLYGPTSIVAAGAGQFQGYSAAGFTGAGAEIGLSGGIAYIQAYDRTNSVYIPLTLNATLLTMSGTITVQGAGGVGVGNPTGGNLGYGYVNVSGGYRVNNVALPTLGANNSFTGTNTFAAISVNGTSLNYSQGTFTVTMRGGITTPTATAKYQVVGNQVTVSIPSILASASNYSYLYLTGLPGTLQPLGGMYFGCSGLNNFSSGGESGLISVGATTTLGLYLYASGGGLEIYGAYFGTSSAGQAGLATGVSFSYALN